MRIIFDIGGTNTRVAAVKDSKEFIGKPLVFRTSADDFPKGVRLIAEAASKLAGGEKITSAAGGTAGQFDKAKSEIINKSNLPDWTGKPLKRELEKALGCEVRLENDAALAALGEAHFGAGKEKEIVAYLTIGTGFGGARVVNGKIDENSHGFEPGYQIIDSNKTAQELLSGNAIKEKFGKNPREIEDPAVWRALAEKLAIAVNNIIASWSPDIVVFGGSMMTGSPAIPLEETGKALGKISGIASELPPLVLAELGDYGVLKGATLL